jgi:hypothetical protein
MLTDTLVTTPTRRRRYAIERLLGFPTLLTAVLATCVYLFIPHSMEDPDIWWHLRNAQYLVSTHSFITKDMYSFTTAGAPWMNHEWLAELPFYFAWQLLGPRGLFVVTLATVECIFLGVFHLACRHATNPKAALIASVAAAFLATVSYGPRTLLFGWLALVAELLILEQFRAQATRRSHRVLWMLPVLFAGWVNTHGSWVIGIVVLFSFLAAGSFRMRAGTIDGNAWTPTQLRRLGAASGLSLAALMLNPYGWRLVAYPFNLAFHQQLNIANVDEWSSLDFHSVRGHVLLVSLTLVFFAQLYRPRKWAPYQLAFVFIGVYSAFTYYRFLFLAAILIFPLFARYLDGLPAYRPEQNKPWLNAAILCVLAGIFVVRFPARADYDSATSQYYPVTAMPYLRSFHPLGPVFNDYLWGGYLDWNLRQIPVFVDSRVDIFEYAGVFKDYLDAVRVKDSLFILGKYKIRYVLFERDTAFVYLLEHTGQWKVDYQDKHTILLERSSSPLPWSGPTAKHD